MPDEDTTKDPVKPEGEKPVVPVDKPLSLVEEIKGIRDDIFKARDEIKSENDRKEKLQAEAMLSGTGGAGIKAEPPKEETPKEYNDRIDKELLSFHVS